MKYILLLITILAAPGGLAARERLPELKVVEQFDVNRGSGTWYETARITHWFQRGLVCATAGYSVLPNGKLSILNTARKGRADGKLETASYTAKIVDKLTNAKVSVTYFWPLSAEFYIIDLGEDYEYAVVGEPKRKYLWILSRTARMDPEVYNGILERLKEQGYDPVNIEMTPQE